MSLRVRLARSMEKGASAAFFVLAACSSASERSAPSAAASSLAPTGVASSAQRPAPSASPEARDPKRARALLVEGRKLEKDERWREAQAKLAEALELAPDDVNVLSELGWAALHAGDLEAAQRAGERALGLSSDNRVRAQVLYNLGRVAEAKHDAAHARELYERSLTLRASKPVEERLQSLGGQAPKQAPTADLPCHESFANTAALCECLSRSPQTCGAAKDVPTLESGELEVVATPTDTDGETLLLLVANDKGGVRPVAELGRDYHPSSFGIDDTAKVLSFDEQTIGGKKVAIVRTDVTSTDSNNGGAEVMTVHRISSTICVLRSDRAPTVCPVSVPTQIDDSHAFPRAKESLGADDKAYVEAHAKEAHEYHLLFDVKLSARGDVAVTLDKGEEKQVPPGILGHHALF